MDRLTILPPKKGWKSFFFLNVPNGLTNFNFSTGVIQACWRSRSPKKLPGPDFSTGVIQACSSCLFLKWYVSLLGYQGPSKILFQYYCPIYCTAVYTLKYFVCCFVFIFCLVLSADSASSPCLGFDMRCHIAAITCPGSCASFYFASRSSR